MRYFLTIAISLFTFSNICSAANKLIVKTINPQDCRGVGHIEQYVLDDCMSFRKNGDRIMLQGTFERSNLVITDSRRNNNPYFMPLGLENAKYSVSQGDIQVVYRNTGLGMKALQAVIYRLDYETAIGQKGFQIITIRLGNWPYKRKNTCTALAYDSNDSSVFADTPAEQLEAKMRERALELISKDHFQNPNNRCMLYEHDESRRDGNGKESSQISI